MLFLKKKEKKNTPPPPSKKIYFNGMNAPITRYIH